MVSLGHLVGSLLAVPLGELLTEGDDFGVQSVDFVVEVFDALVLGLVAGPFGDGEARADVWDCCTVCVTGMVLASAVSMNVWGARPERPPVSRSPLWGAGLF